MSEEMAAFFWARVDRRGEDECWPWTGYINPSHGYGEASLGKRGAVRRWRAHRLALHIAGRDVAAGSVVMHTCDNPKCVNPNHLEVGTVSDNNRDMISKGRYRSANGVKTKCAQGHEFSAENTDFRGNQRRCRTCDRLNRVRRKEARDARSS